VSISPPFSEPRACSEAPVSPRPGLVTWLLGLGLSASLFLQAQALELNQASEAELDSLLGVGPALSGRILQARRSGPFTDWADLIQRVPGIGTRSARKLSAQGATIQGQGFEGSQPSEKAVQKAE
jgi:competence protein ComEA